MVFGTGFAPFRGGPLHYRSTHADAASTQRDAAE
jgi:3-hydroxyacyl-CoA dehydrogenase/enoyl-CoA hydratase/3-hydroxybutyryl-CoA epimerase